MQKTLAIDALALATIVAALSAAPAAGKPTYVTFEGGSAFSINSLNSVTGFATGDNSFVRTADGSFTTFDVPGATRTEAFSINDAGTIIGDYQDGLGTYRGFIRAADGTITTFDVHFANATRPVAINNNGKIAGYYSDVTGDHAFLRTAEGRLGTFDVPGETDTRAYSINDRGVVTGQAGSDSFIRTADGTITTFSVPGATWPTIAVSINLKGDVTGYYADNHGEHGFVRAQDGTITSFDDPNCHFRDDGNVYYATFPAAINNKGTVLGQCAIGGRRGRFVGFIRRASGVLREFAAPGHSAYTIVNGITNAGVVVGYDIDASFLRFP